MIQLTGTWELRMERGTYEKELPEPAVGRVALPGSLQAAKYGYSVGPDTEWMSGLHNPFWYEREEYSYRPQDGQYRVPFLSQPERHFIGKAHYTRTFTVEPGTEADYTLWIERTMGRSTVSLDGREVGGDYSLCAAHEIALGRLEAGTHTITVSIDNSLQYPYRPDGHSVSDALGATWNGMVGEIALLTGAELEERDAARRAYAAAHPRTADVRDGVFVIDGKAEYFRGTHFGGDYPLTGYPSTDPAWWERLMRTVKEWGLNFIRCHSYCPPEAAFAAADEAGVYLQIECGMWNIFNPGEEEMPEVLRGETRKILRQFGHHPSFVMLSPCNEPGGEWYEPLKAWVQYAREFDRALGYEGRRLYTAESGWFYDKPPREITREETDYLYFHRSAYGPIRGGNIRNVEGWKGKDYSPSLEGAQLPAICHEMGQWCSYPDFNIIDKFTGFFRPGNFELFRENARARGVLPYNADFVYCSGRNQLRMFKEEIEANLRTEHLCGFEMLDLHDYLGQGTALVGLLDAFWEPKGAVRAEEFREFCEETVVLVRLPKYVYGESETLDAELLAAHYGRETLPDAAVTWLIRRAADGRVLHEETISVGEVPAGKNTVFGRLGYALAGLYGADGGEALNLCLELELTAAGLAQPVRNHWELYVYPDAGSAGGRTGDVCDTHDAAEAREALEQGRTVIYRPWLSDLDYECPPVGIRGSFWNDQMGPKWGRGQGLSIRTDHPIFRAFPTAHDGGWQWEEILDYARGFSLKGYPQHEPLVRTVDEWNRNLPMGILLEADVLNGRLILVSADLETDAKKRPAAAALNRAIADYAASDKLADAPRLPWEAIAEHIFPLRRNETLVRKIRTAEPDLLRREWAAKAEVPPEWPCFEDALSDVNLNTTAGFFAKEYPITFTIELKAPTVLCGVYYAPPQKDRMFEGCIREYELLTQTPQGWKIVHRGTFDNSLFAQKVSFESTEVTALRVRVLSCYGDGEKTVWDEARDGWHRTRRCAAPQLQIAAFQVIPAEGAYDEAKVPHDNQRFWMEHTQSGTREIET